MKASKYVSVSSPHTCNMSKKHVPQRVLLQPDFHPANWKRPCVRESPLCLSLLNSQESDSKSLLQETQYQLQLQKRIRENEELAGLYSDELENDSLEEDSLEEMSLKEQGAKYDANRYTNGIQKSDGKGRKQQSVDKYFSLRYNPDWKNTKEVAEFSKAEKARQAAGESSADLSHNSFYLHPNGFPEIKNQQESKSQDSFSEFGTELLSSHEPRAVVSNKPFRLHSKGLSAHGCPFNTTCSSAASPQTREDRPQRAKKDFVEKNKRTLGLRSEKINSYLQLHSKKQEVLQKQVTGAKTVDEEPVQRVLPFQTVKMEPEEKWHLKAQQLKDHQSKSFQKNKLRSNQSLKRRAFPGNDSQQPAESESWHHQISQFQAAPMQAVKQDNSSTWQKYPNPSVGSDTNTAANSDTCSRNFPNSRRFGCQDFTTPAYPFHPTLHKFIPPEVISPAHTSKENKKYHHSSPNGLPRDQQCFHNPATVQVLARGNSANGQAQMMEQHHQELIHLTEAHLADRHLFGLLSPVIPQPDSGLEIDIESSEGNRGKINQSNSEGYLKQMEKQNQPKASKKPYSSKGYINLNVKLGGLGPDYEAIKEKKEKLKQQKEYAKQVKEHNMKSIASVQRLPTKPQVVSSVSRQKALDYAKKIPRPKTFTARQSAEAAKKARVLPQTLNADSLPQIASLETLRNRHEKEKEVVAAFRTLHILQVF